jgi:hypothetical protein
MTRVARSVDGMCVMGLLRLTSKYTRSGAELGFFERAPNNVGGCMAKTIWIPCCKSIRQIDPLPALRPRDYPHGRAETLVWLQKGLEPFRTH